MTGDWNNLKQTGINTGDLPEGQGGINRPITSEQLSGSTNSTLLTWLRENPEVVLSEIVRVLNLLDNVENWWYGISQIKAEDGTILLRITIAPPENYEISVLENESQTINQIVLRNK